MKQQLSSGEGEGDSLGKTSNMRKQVRQPCLGPWKAYA